MSWGSSKSSYVRGREIPFAYNVERTCMEELRLLAHCGVVPVTANISRCVVVAEEISRQASQQGQLDAMLAGLCHVVGADTAEGITAPTEQRELWARRWGELFAARSYTTNVSATAEAITTPLVSSPQHPRSPQRASPFLHASPGGRVIVGDVDAIRAWVALVVATRCVALTHLREMVVLQLQMQYCTSYWRWALEQPWRCLGHTLMSGRHDVWRALCTGANAAMHHTMRQTVNRLKELQDMEVFVVSCIGRVYNAMEALNRSLHAIANGDVVSSASTAADGGNYSGHGYDPSDVGAALGAAVTKALRSMTQRSYRAAKRAASGNLDHTSSHVSLFQMPHVDSMTMGDLELPVHTERSIQRHSRMLAASAHSQQEWVCAWRRTLAEHMTPPAGRHWVGVVATAVVMIPLVRASMTMTGADVQRYALKARDGIEYVVRWYVVGPCMNLYASLYASRVGVEERREKLHRDVQSIAKIIKDYHKDYYDEPSPHELEEIRINAIEGDYGLISRHLEQAIRHPIKGFLFGNLVRLTLIHVQELKLEVSRVLASFDEVLEANDVNFRMMALGPVIVLGVALVSYLALRKKKKLQPAYVKMRVLWRSLHRLVTFARTDDWAMREQDSSTDDDRAEDGFKQQRNALGQRRTTSSSSGRSFLDDEEQGRVVLMVHHMRSLREFVADYPLIEEFLEDLDDLEAMHSTRRQRLRTLDRMMAIHHFLAPREE